MNIAHYFTFFRIFVSPIFLLVYIAHEQLGISSTLLPYVLIFLLGMSEFSDAFDGYIARKTNQVTDLGKILDPMADSIYRISVFLTFTLDPIRVPMILIFVFIYRDSVISTLRTICALRGYTLAARISGKIKARADDPPFARYDNNGNFASGEHMDCRNRRGLRLSFRC